MRPAGGPAPLAGGSGLAWWCAIAAVLVLGALLAHGRSPAVIDWQPGLAWRQPWRWWSAAWVHYSTLHLGANLVGAALVAALGWAARVRRRAALAWLIAWPLGHAALALEPAVRYYGGLSGVLHAGVAVIAVELVRSGPRQRRWIGGALLAGLAVKIILEKPWAAAVQHPPGWDIATVPLAHFTGVVAGVLAALTVGRREAAPGPP